MILSFNLFIFVSAVVLGRTFIFSSCCSEGSFLNIFFLCVGFFAIGIGGPILIFIPLGKDFISASSNSLSICLNCLFNVFIRLLIKEPRSLSVIPILKDAMLEGFG